MSGFLSQSGTSSSTTVSTKSISMLRPLVAFRVFAMEWFHASSWWVNIANDHETPALSQERGKAPQKMKRFSFWGRGRFRWPQVEAAGEIF